MASDLRNALTEADATTEQHLLTHRRELHAAPELSLKEAETAAYVAERLDALSPDRLERGVGGQGVVADFKGRRRGLSVLLRADMDGLPIQEDGDLLFRSTRRGVMHACGHDVHMAIALEVARVFAEHRQQLAGQLRIAFQPAEECAGGAKPMIAAGTLDGIDRVVGLHVWAGLPTGQVSVRSGAMMASADWFTLTVRGSGGHGAMPELAVDAVVIAAQIVTGLQTLVSREISPRSPAVVTLGSIHGGTAFNIIAGEVVMQGTVRTFEAQLRERVLQRIEQLAAGIASGMRGSCEFRLESTTLPVVNDPAMARLVQEAARSVLGDAAVVPFEPLMVGEDVAYFLEARPGCFFLLGGAPPEGPALHHTADFRVDERCLLIGFRVMMAAVLRLLEDEASGL